MRLYVSILCWLFLNHSALSSQVAIQDDVQVLETYNHVNHGSQEIVFFAEGPVGFPILFQIDSKSIFDENGQLIFHTDDGSIGKFKSEISEKFYFGVTNGNVVEILEYNFIDQKIRKINEHLNYSMNNNTDAYIRDDNSFAYTIYNNNTEQSELWSVNLETETSVKENDVNIREVLGLGQGFRINSSEIYHDLIFYGHDESGISGLYGYNFKDKVTTLMLSLDGSNPSDIIATPLDYNVLIWNMTSNGLEIWNVLLAGDRALFKIIPEAKSHPSNLTSIDDLLFFALETEQGREPWISDLTPDGTFLLQDINVLGDSDPGYFTKVGESIIFSAQGSNFHSNIFTIDINNTTVQKIESAQDHRDIENLMVFGDHIYFNEFSELYRVDLNFSNEELIDQSVFNFHLISNHIFFSSRSHIGIINKTGDIRSINMSQNRIRSFPLHFSPERIYLFGYTDYHGSELLVLDSPFEKVVEKADFNKKFAQPAITYQSIGQNTMIVSPSQEKGIEPHMFNHASTDFEIFKDFTTNGSSFPGRFSAHNNNFIFQLTSSDQGNSIWSANSNGSTELIWDLSDNPFASFIPIGHYNQYLLFKTADGTYSTDGTRIGTRKIYESGLNPTVPPLILNDRFWATDIYGIIKTDGTPQNTNWTGLRLGSCASHIYQIGGKLYFMVNDGLGACTHDLWVSDGTPEGTELFQKLNTTNGCECISKAAVSNDKLIFEFDPWRHGPLISLSTTTGHIDTLITSVDYASIVHTVGDIVFLTTDDGFYRTDGTKDNTVKLKSGSAVSSSVDSTAVYYITNRTNKNQIEMIKHDSKDPIIILPSIAKDVRNPHFHNNRIFFSGRQNENEPYRLFTAPLIERQITLHAFNDQNQNGIKDHDEFGLENIEIQVNNTTKFTDREGKIQLGEINQSISVAARATECWGEDYSLSFNNIKQDTLILIPFSKQANIENLELSITTAPTRCGFKIPLWLYLTNNGCNSQSGLMGIVLEQNVSLEEISTMYHSISGDTIWFRFDNLLPTRRIRQQLKVRVANEDYNGQDIIVSNFVKINNSTQSIESFVAPITCAIDPNDKLVHPSRDEESNSNYTELDERIDYTIRFQNTGTDTAFNIVLIDTLSNMLDWTSFRQETSSHEYTTTIDESGIITFRFYNILLPDHIVDEVGSHGFVKYSIKAKNTLPDFSVVENTAGIYFDFNRPIITNTIENTLVESIDKDGDASPFWIDCDDNESSIYPGAVEIENNDVDENCDGLLLVIDNDSDGYNSSEDCNDNDSSVNPGAEEIENNEVDENCDGALLYIDVDGDGFHSDIDCDDNESSVNPGAEEIANNEVDENCDGVLLVIDEDEDGFNSSVDCDDNDPAINPDAEEIGGNDIDENCDGVLLTTSVKDEFLSRVKIFPNPVDDLLFLNGLNDVRIEEIQLINVLGQQMDLNIISTGQKQYKVKMSLLESGVYLVTVKIDGALYVYPVIKT